MRRIIHHASRTLARRIDVAGAEWLDAAFLREEAVAPDAAVVVAEQVQRDRGGGRDRPDAVDVVLRQQLVEVAGPQALAQAEREVGPPVGGGVVPPSKTLATSG